MPDAYSIRESLQGALADFVRESGITSTDLEGMIREFVGLLAAYREEGHLLFPEVFVFASVEGLKALAPSGPVITIGTTTLDSTAAGLIVKNAATLAFGGWAIFAVREGAKVRYGIFRAIRHSLSTAAEESMRDLGVEIPVILIRNRGNLVVELRSTVNKRFTATLTTESAQASSLEKHIKIFVEAASASIPEPALFSSYLYRLLTDVLQHCHGTLLAVVPVNKQPDKSLKDGVWLSPLVDLAFLHATALASNTADALADLHAAESLVKGMIGSDGVVIFGSDGTARAYRVFLKPAAREKAKLPEKGGGRRRTYELMKLRLGNVFQAVFFRSQDGETGCDR